MAKRRHHRRRARHHRAGRRRRHNPMSYLARGRNRHTYRRRRRHNPTIRGSVRQLFSGGMIKTTLGAFAGYTGARMIPATLLKQYNNGVTGYALNVGAGLLTAWAVGMADAQAGQGAVIGTGLAVLSRILVEQFKIGGADLSGDMDFDLGYYVSDRFPFAQGAGGPYDTFPGNPSLLSPPFPATSAAAVRAGAAAAAAALPAAAAPGIAGVSEGGRWGAGRWS